MAILTDKERLDAVGIDGADDWFFKNCDAIESAVLAKIKAQGPAAFIFDENYEALLPDEVEGNVFKESPHLYTPLYKLPEGD